ncbi:MAG: RsmE family RNA methyltransferase [Chitinophagaceae bacterium]
MAFPFFYIDDFNGATDVVLDEDNSRHAISVLRMTEGEQMHLTDGKGYLLTGSIADAHKKKCRVAITDIQQVPAVSRKTAVGISLVKNPVRFEWFLEKATEMGISEIFPLLCERTEKQHFRQDRMQHVMVSALLQSRQAWLPILHEPIKFDRVIDEAVYQQKFIAHCLENEKQSFAKSIDETTASAMILIGPEGDFSPAEISRAFSHNFIPVALGNTRLRTETAGMVAAALLKNID